MTLIRAAAVIETSVANRAFISLINHQTTACSTAATPHPSHPSMETKDANGRDDNTIEPVRSFPTTYEDTSILYTRALVFVSLFNIFFQFLCII
jgi:hypothetical protein